MLLSRARQQAVFQCFHHGLASPTSTFTLNEIVLSAFTYK